MNAQNSQYTENNRFESTNKYNIQLKQRRFLHTNSYHTQRRMEFTCTIHLRLHQIKCSAFQRRFQISYAIR